MEDKNIGVFRFSFTPGRAELHATQTHTRTFLPSQHFTFSILMHRAPDTHTTLDSNLAVGFNIHVHGIANSQDHNTSSH